MSSLFRNGTLPKSWLFRCAQAAVGIFVFALVDPTHAEPSAIDDRELPVSTRPTVGIAPVDRSQEAVRSRDEPRRPLTRAAVQRRIDSISPVEWLARFGRVEVKRRN